MRQRSEKLAAEVQRLRTKLSEQAATLQARRESYEGHARRVHQLKDERLVIEAQSLAEKLTAEAMAQRAATARGSKKSRALSRSRRARRSGESPFS